MYKRGARVATVSVGNIVITMYVNLGSSVWILYTLLLIIKIRIIIDIASSSSASRVVLRVIVVDDHRRRPGNGDAVQRQVRFVAVPSGRGPAALDDQPAGLCTASAAAVFVVVVVVVVFAASSAPSVLVISSSGPVDGMLLLLLLTSAESFDGQADQEEAHGGRQCDYSLHEYRSDVEAQVEQRVQRARQALHFLQTRSDISVKSIILCGCQKLF